MATYRFEAVDRAGQLMRGTMEGANRHEVAEQLQRQGYLPLLAEANLGAGRSLPLLQRTNRILARDIALLTRELASMLKAGLPLERALSILVTTGDRRSTDGLIRAVLGRLRQGASFADALADHKNTLPRTYVEMVRAGELGGGKMLESSLESLAGYLQQSQAIRDKLAASLVYPGILLVMSVLSILVILLFVLPQFEPVFMQSKAALPFSTQLLLGTSHALRQHGALIVLLASLGTYVLWSVYRHRIAAWWDATALRLPYVKTIIAKSESAGFCHTLGTLLAHGVPPVQAMAVAAEGFKSTAFIAAAGRAVTGIREGASLAAILQAEKLFPPLVYQMARIGEETGRLPTMLLQTAEISQRDVQRTIERMMMLLTPLLTVVSGIIIAGIIATVISAILSVNDIAG